MQLFFMQIQVVMILSKESFKVKTNCHRETLPPLEVKFQALYGTLTLLKQMSKSFSKQSMFVLKITVDSTKSTHIIAKLIRILNILYFVLNFIAFEMSKNYSNSAIVLSSYLV